MAAPDPFHARVVQTFWFDVALYRSAGEGPAGASDRLCDGAFQECAGLELAAEIKEYAEGGRNDGVVQRVGRVKLQPIVLKRGMFTTDGDGQVQPELWQWLQGMVAGVRPVPRYNGRIEVRAGRGRPIQAVWTFERGLPLKVTGPALNAKTGDLAIEEMHIAHEGLRLVTR
ncbi:phage tail protein [Nonomuraea zeae]|uniref:Phage tail protein n=1 Tax=Nonomuraea zeae TaxID=1642303 RepID=A0A5S4GTH7_9ACTN|nr:phage tail protein [Nonomuraea zeae]TMR36248.1 phage tail protein [Nonomuraea zeae]